jgi:hypothetical protein
MLFSERRNGARQLERHHRQELSRRTGWRAETLRISLSCAHDGLLSVAELGVVEDQDSYILGAFATNISSTKDGVFKYPLFFRYVDSHTTASPLWLRLSSFSPVTSFRTAACLTLKDRRVLLSIPSEAISSETNSRFCFHKRSHLRASLKAFCSTRACLLDKRAMCSPALYTVRVNGNESWNPATS